MMEQAGITYIKSLQQVVKITRRNSSELWGIVFEPPRQDGKVLIGEVVHDSPAHRSGLAQGSAVLSIDGHSIDSLVGQVTATLKANRGTTLTLKVQPLLGKSEKEQASEVEKKAKAAAEKRIKEGKAAKLTAKLAAEKQAKEEKAATLLKEANAEAMRTQRTQRVVKITRQNSREKWGIVFARPRQDGKVLIQEVVRDSPAHRSGLSHGSAVLSIDGRSIDSLAGQVTATLMKHRSTTLTMEVQTKGRQTGFGF